MNRDAELARGPEGAHLPVPPGSIALATAHHATVVKVTDIKHVCRVAANPHGERGLVILHDDTHYRVPDPDAVLRAMKEARR